MIKNEKSLKKDGRKKLSLASLESPSERIFFVHLFSTIFHFLIAFSKDLIIPRQQRYTE